jgi:hypothetical protein
MIDATDDTTMTRRWFLALMSAAGAAAAVPPAAGAAAAVPEAVPACAYPSPAVKAAPGGMLQIFDGRAWFDVGDLVNLTVEPQPVMTVFDMDGRRSVVRGAREPSVITMMLDGRGANPQLEDLLLQSENPVTARVRVDGGWFVLDQVQVTSGRTRVSSDAPSPTREYQAVSHGEVRIFHGEEAPPDPA